MSSPHQSSQIAAMNPSNAPLRTFTLFLKLPLELQQIIWLMAYEEESGPEPKVFQFAEDGSDTLENGEWAEICRHKLRLLSPRLPIPASLGVCKYTRAMALKDYTAWPCYDPKTYMKSNYQVFARPKMDIFLFDGDHEDDFSYLNLLVNSDNLEFNEYNPDMVLSEMDDPNFHEISMIVKGAPIRHLAFSWRLWSNIINNDPIWMNDIPKMKQITIVLDACPEACEHPSKTLSIKRFQVPQKGSGLERCAKTIEDVTLNDYIRRLGSERQLPKLQALVAERDCTCVKWWSDAYFDLEMFQEVDWFRQKVRGWRS